MIELFLKGLLIGLAIAAPIGPMSILCMQRTLHEGFRVGFLSGIGFCICRWNMWINYRIRINGVFPLSYSVPILDKNAGGCIFSLLGHQIYAHAY